MALVTPDRSRSPRASFPFQPRMSGLLVAFILVSGGCARSVSVETRPDTTVVLGELSGGGVAEGGGPPSAPNAVAEARSSEALYASCQERVEGPSTPGECSSDADCMRVGCSQEVCIASSQGDIVTTCEIRPCFRVLDACGCKDGTCTWSLKSEAPTGQRFPGFTPGATTPTEPTPSSSLAQ